MIVALVGNPGRLRNSIFEFFRFKGINVDLYDADGMYKIKCETGCVLFCGGETRDNKKMVERNVVQPKFYLQQAIELDAHYVYLTSLSVFGWKLDVNTLKGERHPTTLYGKTKNEFDEWVSSSDYKNTTALFVASIKSGNGRSAIERWNHLQKSFPIMKHFSFSGCLTYVCLNKLVEELFHVTAMNINGRQFVCQNYPLKKGVDGRFVIKIPRIPDAFFYIIAFLFGHRMALTAKIVLRGIIYNDT
jgi:hypothetical protein